MTGPLRPCGNPRCRLCNPRPLPEPESESLAMLLLGMAGIVVLFVLAFFLLPVMA
jgi:hypothetical protein